MKSPHQQAMLVSAFAIVLLVGSRSFAKESHCPTHDSPPLAAMLLPPPCDGCEETRAELTELLELQKSRTPDQAEHARGDHKRSVGRFLGEIGLDLDGKLPLSGHLFECIAEIVDDEIRDAKATFHRTRPYRLPHNELEFLKELRDDDSYSYPSGHAAYGAVVGLVLVAMVPEKQETILRRIEDYGHSRMVAGVHFRSDIYAGQIAGSAIAASLFRNHEFSQAVENAKPEVRKALGY